MIVTLYSGCEVRDLSPVVWAATSALQQNRTNPKTAEVRVQVFNVLTLIANAIR
jgi:hypothetical protein